MSPRFFVNDPDLVKARRDPLTAPVMTGKPTRPAKEYADQGTVGPADYADPQNFKYPLHKAANVKAAIQYFSNAKNAGKYSADEQAAIWGRIKVAAGKFGIAIQERKFPMSKSMSGLERINQYLELSKAGGPYIGPKGGKWADAQHKVSWKELGKTQSGKPIHEATHADYNTTKKVKGEPRHGPALYEHKVMREQFPQHTKQDHADAAKIHQEHAGKTATEHAKLAAQAEKAWGTEPRYYGPGVADKLTALKEQSTKSSQAATQHEAAGKAMKRNPAQPKAQAEEKPFEQPDTGSVRDVLPASKIHQAHAEKTEPSRTKERSMTQELKDRVSRAAKSLAQVSAKKKAEEKPSKSQDMGPAAMEQRAKPAHAAMKAADGARKEAFADMLNPQAHQRAINALTAAHKKVEEHREHFPVSGEDGTPASAHMAGIKAELAQHGMYLTAAQLHEKADKSGDPSLHQGAAAVLDAARDNSPAGPHHQVIKEAADKHKAEARKARGERKTPGLDALREKFDKDRPDVKAAEMSHAAKQASEKIKSMRPGDPGFQEAHTAAAEGHRKAREALNSARDEQQKATGFSGGSQGTAHYEGEKYHEHQAKKTGGAPEKKTPALDAMREKKAALSEGQRLGGEAHGASAKTQGMKVSDPGFHAAHTAAQKAHEKARATLMSEADKKGKDTGTHPGYSVEAIHHNKAANHHRILASTPAGYWKNRPKEDTEAPKPAPAPALEKKPEPKADKKGQLSLFGGGNVKKSLSGLDGLGDFLRKAEPQALPTGEPSMGGSGAEQGGDVAGKGKVSGDPSSAPSKGFDKDGKAQGVSPGKSEKLSEDDEDVEAQLKNKAPKTLGKSMSMPAHQREMVAREHAMAVSRLVRGERDIVVGCGPGAPPADMEPLQKAHSWTQGRDSRVVYSDASDQAVEQLLKGDPFYVFQAPTTKRDSILIHQVRECGACKGTFTKSLASCPHCGVGSLNPLVALHGHIPVEELQKSRAPLLRPRVERDLYFGKK